MLMKYYMHMDHEAYNKEGCTEMSLHSIVQNAEKSIFYNTVALFFDVEGVFGKARRTTSVKACRLELCQSNWLNG